MDLYWGGPEPRITTLTLKIIAVNAIALLLLAIGILFLGRYHENLVATKLQTFQTETHLLGATLSELGDQKTLNASRNNTGLLRDLIARFVRTTGDRIIVFNMQGERIMDTLLFEPSPYTEHFNGRGDNRKQLDSVEILKDMASFIVRWLPRRDTLPDYNLVQTQRAGDYPFMAEALEGQTSLSAWRERNNNIVLTAALPLVKDGKISGAVLLERKAHDIKHDVADAWLNLFSVFVATLIITTLLSIYLAGVIARPLRRLAVAAEKVRKEKGKFTDIPDYSARNDEIGELSVALRQMTKALASRIDAIERFASEVSHELKNPLTSLKSAVETAAIVKKDKDREKLMAIVKEDIHRLNRLITDIASASRLDAALSRERLQIVNLKGVLHAVLDLYAEPLVRANRNKNQWDTVIELSEHKIIMSSTVAHDLYVEGYAKRFEQVFENLVSNALSFSPKNGIVTIRIEETEKTVHIDVDDEGPGIPENKRAEIFERFYSDRPEHEKYGQHSGLGLSICKQIVEAANGYINADNIKDDQDNIVGARFSVVLKKVPV